MSLAPVRIDVPPATITVTDSDGNLVPPPPIPAVVWHESFRYFRLSQTTDHLFDAYRNAYLALESVLSSVAPQVTNTGGKVAEREGDWFKRALAEANKILPLRSFAPAGSADPVPEIFDELYVSMRSAMSHAKSGRKVLLPQDEAERADVTASLRRLVSLYLKLAEIHLGARRPGGAMYPATFRTGFASILERTTIYASDDELPFDKSTTSPNPGGGALKVLAGVGDVRSSGFIVTRLWSASRADLSDLPFVRSVVGMLDDDAPGFAAVLEGQLVLGSAQRLEVILGARGSNTRQPRGWHLASSHAARAAELWRGGGVSRCRVGGDRSPDLGVHYARLARGDLFASGTLGRVVRCGGARHWAARAVVPRRAPDHARLLVGHSPDPARVIGAKRSALAHQERVKAVSWSA